MLSLADDRSPAPDWASLPGADVRTVAEILAELEGLPEFLIDELVHANTTLLVGPAKAGKSYLVVELVKALTTASDSWHGRQVHGGPHRVLLLPSDPGTRAEYARRLGPSVGLGVGLGKPPRVGDLSVWAHLADAAARVGVGMVVLDSLYSWARLADINANAEIGAALACLDELTDRGIAVLVVHHTSKGGDSPAGAHSVEANFRHVVSLTKGGRLVVKGNDVPEARYALSREQGRITSITNAGTEAPPRVSTGQDRPAGTAQRRQAAREAKLEAAKLEAAKLLLADAPPGTPVRELGRWLARQVPGVRNPDQGRRLAQKALEELRNQGEGGRSSTG